VTLNDGNDTVITLPLASSSVVAKITTINFVPAYSDGMATMSVTKDGKAVLEASYDVRPAAVAETIAANASWVSFSVTTIATRAAVSLPATSVAYADGKLTVKADASACVGQNIAVSLLVNDEKCEFASAFVSVKAVESFITYAGETYNVVTLKDGRTWMAENLRYLPEGLEAKTDFTANTGVWYSPLLTWDGTTATMTPTTETLATQGYLYTTAVAMNGQTLPTTDFVDATSNQGICPDGWHIPTAQEWVDLVGACAATAHNNTSAPYYVQALSGASLEDLNADGFNFLPYPVVNQGKSYLGSVLNADSSRTYCGMASTVYFASSTGRSATQSYAAMITNNKTKTSVNCAYNNLTNGVYVRCIKNR
ncbi:MAG: hypothetical protein MJY67_06900, partial [Bacteroidales bacterium]|nr:hypothetical protein [Bacteroidales bacterium]